MVILKTINYLMIRIQRRVQGIPKPGSIVYGKLASKLLRTLHLNVVDEILSRKTDCKRVLDLGCGTADLLTILASKSKEFFLVGLDISWSMLRVSLRNIEKHNFKEFIDLINADAHKLPLRDKSIDLIVSTGTLHHIRKPEEVFFECVRVLSNSGEAWIYEFSHDIALKEVSSSSKRLKRSRLLLKTIAALHGIPRREFIEGCIRKSLKKANVCYELKFNGIVTKLVIRTH